MPVFWRESILEVIQVIRVFPKNLAHVCKVNLEKYIFDDLVVDLAPLK